MFVRKKKNKSGTVSIQIVLKEHGRYVVFQTIGCSKDPDKIERLILTAKDIINNPKDQQKIFSIKSQEDLAIENFLSQLSNSNIRTKGPEIIFGTLFDKIGFDAIKDKLFRHIVIARLAYTTSKLKTVDYLYRYRGINIEVDQVYRFLDRLNKRYKEQAERVAYEYTKKELGGKYYCCILRHDHSIL